MFIPVPSIAPLSGNVRLKAGGATVPLEHNLSHKMRLNEVAIEVA